MKQYLGVRIVKTFLITIFLCMLGVSYAQSAKTTSIPASDAADHKQLLRAVMNEFYGSFDPNKNCWISKHEDATYCMNPVRADSVSWPDRQLLFVAVGGHQLDENGEPLKSRPSIGVLGLIVLTPNNSNLSLVATNGLYEAFASYGRSPDRGSISVRELGPNGNYGWVAERDDVHSGEESKWSQLYGVIGNSVVLLSEIPLHYANPMTCESEGTRFCTDLSAEIAVDTRAAPSSFYPLVMRVKGIRKGRPFHGNFPIAFDKGTRAYTYSTSIPYEIQPLSPASILERRDAAADNAGAIVAPQSSPNVATQGTTSTTAEPTPKQSRTARSPASFDTTPEVDYRALFALFMASNADLLDTPAFAWENFVVNHVPDGTRNQSSRECFQLTQRAANEFERARIVDDAQRTLKDDLRKAAGQPKTRVFKLRQRVHVDAYDTAAGGFRLNKQMVTILGGERPLEIARDYLRRSYDGPVQAICNAAPGIGFINKLPGAEALPRNHIGNLALAIVPVLDADYIKLSPAEAESFLARQGGGVARSREAILEVLVEAGPAIINPKTPGVIPARVVAARAIDPTTNSVISNFDITASAKAAGDTNDDKRSIFNSKAMALVALNARPDIMSDAVASNLARQQVFAEQRCYSELEKRVSSGSGTRAYMLGNRVDTDHPVFSPSWTSVKDASPERRSGLEGVFEAPNASWDFLKFEANYDARLNHYIEAFIFDRESIRDREPGVAAQQLASLFKEHALSVARLAPSRFALTAPLPELTYDPKDHALHTDKDVPHELLNRFNAGAYEEPDVKTRLIYMTSAFASENEKQWPGAPSGCRHPTEAWRETISGFVNGGSGSSFGVPLVAFDRQLSFSRVELDPAKAAKLINNAIGSVHGLQARINFTVEGVTLPERPSKKTERDLIFKLHLDSVELLSGQNVVTRIAPEKFEDGEALLARLSKEASERQAKAEADQAAAKALEYQQKAAQEAAAASAVKAEAEEFLQRSQRPSGAFGPAVSGVKLGMKITDADVAIRENMNVKFTGSREEGRIYVTPDFSKVMSIYTRPGAGAEDRVVAVVKRFRLPQSHMTVVDAADELIKSYGEPTARGGGGDMAWYAEKSPCTWPRLNTPIGTMDPPMDEKGTPIWRGNPPLPMKEDEYFQGPRAATYIDMTPALPAGLIRELGLRQGVRQVTKADCGTALFAETSIQGSFTLVLYDMLWISRLYYEAQQSARGAAQSSIKGILDAK